MQTPTSHTTWAAHELAQTTLGDARLTKRFIRIVADKLANPTASIPQASGTWAATKATYRFFASPQVSASALRASHAAATVRRAAQHPTVLLLQDTTELNYSTHPHTRDLGFLDNPKSHGIKVHSGMAATLDGVPLGIVHQEVWTRDPATKGIPPRKRPHAERESHRWLTTLAAVQQTIPAPTRVIVVADREADLYPLFIAPRDARTDLVIRATHDRGLVGGQRLSAVIAQVPRPGSGTVAIPPNGTRPARTASVAVGWSSLQWLPPTDAPHAATAPRPTLQLVVVEETAPPAGVRPLRWWLWTTLPVATLADAEQVVAHYRHRWLIERYHFVLKSGCGVEQLQLETRAGLERALAVCSLVAWRLLWLTYQARQSPEEPCTSVFAPHEWQVLHCTLSRTTTLPAQPPSLREATRMVARLGGFLARAGDGEPGVKTIWRGLIRLDDLAATWLLARGSEPPT